MRPMRVVLAMDEPLGSHVARRLPWSPTVYNYGDMKKDAAECARKASLAPPCVLGIGGVKWNPLPWLERWKLPSTTAVVLLLPSISDDEGRRAAALGVFSVVPIGMDDAASCVADECVLAGDHLLRKAPPLIRPVVVVPQPRRRLARSEGQVIALPRRVAQ